jgi:hypothetical protein
MQKLYAALAKAQAEMPDVPKDGRNPHFKSRFTTLDTLIKATRPILAKHGLSILQFPGTSFESPALVTVLAHESGDSIEHAVPMVLTKQTPQEVGAAITYYRRYAWASVLGIASDDDDDGNAASGVNGSKPSASDKPGRIDDVI